MPGSLLNATMRTEVCWRTGPGILAAPAAHVALRRGCDILADVVRPTLGPTPRCVAVQDIASGRPIEILDDAATILRRIIEITDPYANMGAMLLRHAAWQTWEAVGDGAAITAVLFQAILQQTAPYLAAGGDPITLRHGLERALAAVLTALRALAKPLRGSDEIARAAEAMCHDQDLATLLGEILDIVGADGYVQVEDGFTAGLDRQYVEGVHWDEGYLSRYFVTDQAAQEAWLEDPAILVSDLRLRAADQLIPLLERLAQAERRSLLVIAEEVTGSALGLLVANHQRGTLRTVAVKAPSQGTHRADILEDLAILTGGRVVTAVSGAQAQGVTLADLGRARRAWANAHTFGIEGGYGDPIALRRRIAQLKTERVDARTEDDRTQTQERLGKLLGGVAILRVGGATPTQQEARKAVAQRAVRALKQALRGGVVPGGGAAYVACRSALDALTAVAHDKVAAHALAAALEEPLAVIARNAGYEPAAVVAQVKSSPPGWGFDARTGTIVDMWAAGIVDPVPVLEAALEAAVSGAIMTLTSDVLVHQRKPFAVAKP